MDQDKKQAIALMRYSAIAPLISGTQTDYDSLNSFFREVSAKGLKSTKSKGKNRRRCKRKSSAPLFDNCPFVCINFDFSWLNKARPGCRYIWAFNQTASAQSVA